MPAAEGVSKAKKKAPPPPPKKPPPPPTKAPAKGSALPEVEPIKEQVQPSPEFKDYYESIEEDDIVHEEECLRAPYFVKTWLRYLEHKRVSGTPKASPVVNTIFERALQFLPGSYKLWKIYLERRVSVLLAEPIDETSGLMTMLKPFSDPEWSAVNGCFERAMVFCNKYPTIWGLYLRFLMHQLPQAVTRCRRTFDRALKALPITQHSLIWPEYLAFASRCGGETAVRIWRRYLKLTPEDAESYIELLLEEIEPPRYAEAARVMTILLEDISFQSRKGKSKYQIWTELCDLVTAHPDAMSEPTPDNLLGPGKGSGVGKVEKLPVDKILRYGVSKQNSILQGMFTKKAIAKVKTVRDFTLVFDAYAEFEEGVITARMQFIAREDERRERRMNGEEDENDDDDDDEPLTDEEKADLELDLDLRLARLEKLIKRRPFLVNDVVLRQNPHIVQEWERRAQLWKDRHRPEKVVETYQDAVATIHPKKATWQVDDLAELWCQWAEMELRQRLPKNALEIMDDTLKPQQRLFKSLKLWSFYVDLEESIENKWFEESYKAYERGIELFGYPIAFDIWNVYLKKFVERHGSTKLERARDLFEHAIDKVPPKFAKVLYLMYAKLEEDHGLARRAMRIYDRATSAVSENDRFDVFAIYIAKATSFFGLTSVREIYEKAIDVLPDRQARDMCIKFADVETRLLEIDRSRAIWAYGAQFADPRMDPEFWKRWQDFEVKHGNEETFKEMLRIKRSVQAKYNTDVGFISAQLLAQRATGQEAPDLAAGVPNSMSELEARVLKVNEELEQEEAEKRRRLEEMGGGEKEKPNTTRVVGFVPARAKDALTGKPVFESESGTGAGVGNGGTANPDEIDINDSDDDEDETPASTSKARDNDEEEEEEEEEEIGGKGKKAKGIQKKSVPATLFGGLIEQAEKEKAAAGDSSKDKGKGKQVEDTGEGKALGAKERFKRKR
ncbi:hypothetical protein BC829DRAFT_438561 [Chytridium lagenaria]|nr:hypothetical protein BC829DRAFT_438561 [Chytridium lagenaria]